MIFYLPPGVHCGERLYLASVSTALTDAYGALCRHTLVALPGAGAGTLSGLAFAVKDVFDIEGHRTGAGSPDWLRTHGPAAATAPAVERLLAAGARMIGRAHTDELAYSLNGQNAHYGTPVNPRAPERIPGGSSSGAAVAVAGGLADFALGTDCGGSVRLPASYCGILGFRPSHGRIPADGIVPLAPSFDTVGWFARDAAVLDAVGRVLLDDAGSATAPRRLVIAMDLFAAVPPAVAAALEGAVRTVSSIVGEATRAEVLRGGDIDRLAVFRTLQGAEAWAAHGEWIRSTNPRFGPGVRERFELAAGVTQDQAVKAKAERDGFAAHIAGTLKDGTLLCLPTAPGIAPLTTAAQADLEDFRRQAITLLSVAGLARVPQVSLPLASLDGCPLGLSIIAGRGADTALLALACRVMR
jgi:amidase